MFGPWKKSYEQPRQHIEKQRQHLADKWAEKSAYRQSYAFSTSHLWMWGLDHKGSWALKNWCLLNVVLKKTLQSPLDGKEIQPVNPKGNQCWIFIGRTDDEPEAPILWPSDKKSRLIGKDPGAGKDWEQEKRVRD